MGHAGFMFSNTEADFFFFKEMYAVPKEDIWEMERVKLETCSFAP